MSSTAFDLSRYQDPMTIQRVLHHAKTIAVVGLSANELRASHFVGFYLKRHGYRVVPVNPTLSQVLGLTCYPNLEAAQIAARSETGAGIDLVDVFRASEHVPGIVDDVIRLAIPYLWLQDEVIHDEAVARARASGVKCVQNDCIFREHSRIA